MRPLALTPTLSQREREQIRKPRTPTMKARNSLSPWERVGVRARSLRRIHRWVQGAAALTPALSRGERE